MSLHRALLMICITGMLGACSLFLAEEDESVLSVAGQLLDAQKDEYGEPRKVELPVRVNYTINHKPVIGQKLEVEFEFIAERPLPLLRIGLTTDEGLELVSSEIREQYRDMPARRVLKKTAVVVPKREDRFYLNMYIVTESGEDRRAKLIKVPIAVGEYSLKQGSE